MTVPECAAARKRCAASPGSVSLQRIEVKGSDFPGIASPGYAAPAGFLTLLTHSSSRDPPVLFHTGNAPGIVPFEGFPFRGTVFHLSVRPARLAWAQTVPPRIAMQFLARLPGFSLRGSPWPPPARSAPAQLAPPLGFRPLQGFPFPATAPVVPGASSLGFGTACGQSRRPSCPSESRSP
jgi:hypothetical protein